MEKIIEIWKKENIAQAVFNFYCGGDSMGDTDLSFEDSEGIRIEFSDTKNEDTLATYFDNEVYNNVSFYEASDGHYQGENGNVIITLDENEDMFSYYKDAQSEWSEQITNNIDIELTNDEVEFINEFVTNINGGSDNSPTINYKKDFIMTNKRKELVDNIIRMVDEKTGNYVPEEVNGELEEWYNYTTDINDVTEIIIKDNKLDIEINNNYTTYTDSD
jgi:hypothetical protein